mmetsp:Transcript_35376/g.85937  ORF Transcript_35376/g.85937 Transcript_35376/m.85937 type:complete len:230 (-) Transcript_35376:158-847(-)
MCCVAQPSAPRLAHRAVGVDRRGAFRLDPPGEAADVNVLDRAGALARANHRVVRVARLVADVALRRRAVWRRVRLLLRGAGHLALRRGGGAVGEVLHEARVRGGRDAHVAHEDVRLAEAEDVALAQAPRDKALAAHAQLEEDVAAVAREVGGGVSPALVEHGDEGEGAVLPLVPDVRAPARELQVADKDGSGGRVAPLLLGFHLAVARDGVERGARLVDRVLLVEDALR